MQVFDVLCNPSSALFLHYYRTHSNTQKGRVLLISENGWNPSFFSLLQGFQARVFQDRHFQQRTKDASYSLVTTINISFSYIWTQNPGHINL